MIKYKSIRHHHPVSGYNYLWADGDYPDKNPMKSLGCIHDETKDFWVEDSDPGCMRTTYKHTVCMNCGKLLKVNGIPYKDGYFDNLMDKREPCQGEVKKPRILQRFLRLVTGNN